MLAVEIYYYGVAEPIVIPIDGSDQADATAYFEDLKRTVIEAQRHSERSLSLTPFQRGQAGPTVQPLEIQRLHLVERPAPASDQKQAPAA